jgi:hypothetical protein
MGENHSTLDSLSLVFPLGLDFFGEPNKLTRAIVRDRNELAADKPKNERGGLHQDFTTRTTEF